MKGYNITGASFEYVEVYGVPDGMTASNEIAILSPQPDSPEYIIVNGKTYRLFVSIAKEESCFNIDFIDADGNNVSGMYPETWVSGFARIIRDGTGYRVWCEKNATKKKRRLSLWFRGDNEPGYRLEIPIEQKAEVFSVTIQNNLSPYGMQSFPQPTDEFVFNVLCEGGRKNFKVSSIRLKMFYGEPIEENEIVYVDFDNLTDDEKSKFYSFDRNSAWIYSPQPKYIKTGSDGPYFTHYVNFEDNTKECYVKTDMDKDPSCGGKIRAFRMSKFDNAITAVNDSGNLKVTNYGRLFKSENKTPSYLYEVTICHVDDSDKKAVVDFFYNNLV